MATRGPGHAFPGDLRHSLLHAALQLIDGGEEPGLRAVARLAKRVGHSALTLSTAPRDFS